MDIIFSEYYNWISSNMNYIIDDPLKFVPSSKYDFEQNKNAIIKYILYAGIIIGIMTRNYKLVIMLFVSLIFIQIIGSNINSTKSESDKIINSRQNVCRKSTINNPMGNTLLYTSENELGQSLCKLQDKEIDKNLKYNVYYDSKDLFLKKNNTRSFITMPSQSHPNDIDKYKK
jgi:hypothetical protein